MQKKPTPTVANPQPATSSYLKAPIPIKTIPIIIIKRVAQPRIEFLFVAILKILERKYRLIFY